MQPISLRALIKQAWQLYTKHVWVLVLLAALQLLTGPGEYSTIFANVVAVLAYLLLTLVGVKISLLIVDGKEVSWNRKDFWPTPHEYLKSILLVLAMVILVIGGLILLVIPGIYIMIRLYFSMYSFLANGSANVSLAMSESWKIVKGKIFWKVFLWMLITLVFNIAGGLLFWIGLLVALPITWLGTALLFRELQKNAAATEANIVPKPEELPAQQL